jgi:hypothetical protein
MAGGEEMNALAVLNIFQISPDFQTAVQNVHNTLIPVALVVCFAGLSWLATLALQERSVASIWPALVRILIVALLVTNLPGLGLWLSDAVTSVGNSITGANGNTFQLYTAAIKQKFGVDVSALNQLSPNGPFGNTGSNASAPSSGITVSTYGQANDPNLDPNSAKGIGIAPFDKPGSLNAISGLAIALSPNLTGGLTPGEQITVALANGQTLTGTYADQTAAAYNGQTLSRVDIFNPGDLAQYNSLSGMGVTSIAGGALPSSGNPVGDFFGAMLHPSEVAQVALFGLVVLFISYVALFIMWVMAVIQAVLFYSMIALSPIFLGFLVVPGLQNIGKAFLLSLVGVTLWPIAFLIVSLLSNFMLSQALNTSNNNAIGAANVAGIGYFWLIGLAVWTVIGSIWGPKIVSNRFVVGATGIAELAAVAGAAAIATYRATHSGAAGAIKSLGNGSVPPSSPASAGRGLTPNYATRPMSNKES